MTNDQEMQQPHMSIMCICEQRGLCRECAFSQVFLRYRSPHTDMKQNLIRWSYFNFTNTYLCIYGYAVKACVKRPVHKRPNKEHNDKW